MSAETSGSVPAMHNALLFVLVVIVLLAVLIVSATRIRNRGKFRASPPTQPPGFLAMPVGPSEAEAWVRSHITEIAETQFPDNLGLQWRIHALRHGDGLLFAEVEPVPSEVGYPRFQFAISYTGASAPNHVATYCLEAGRYVLLSTSRDAPRMPPALNDY